jgi:SnoaL-like domain
MRNEITATGARLDQPEARGLQSTWSRLLGWPVQAVTHRPSYDARRGFEGGTMSDRDELVELLARYASIADSRDWDAMPAVLVDPVRWDFESLGGPPARTIALAELAAMFKSLFPGFTATHHAITNHRVTVDGDQATIRAHIRAEHWLPPELVESGPNCWLVVGFYDDTAVRTADGWRLTTVKLSVRYQENAHLFDIALAAATDRRAVT